MNYYIFITHVIPHVKSGIYSLNGIWVELILGSFEKYQVHGRSLKHATETMDELVRVKESDKYTVWSKSIFELIDENEFKRRWLEANLL